MDDVVERILTTYDTITVVGASAYPAKAAHGVPAVMQRHGWRIIPVNPRGRPIFGEQAYRTLAEIPEPVGFVDVFRPSPETPDVARQAVAVGASALWLQLGIASAQARAIAEEAGLLYVESRCMAVERRRLGLDAPKTSLTVSVIGTASFRYFRCSGCRPPRYVRTIPTGQGACCSRALVTEPRVMPGMPPRPREPTTSS
jgi:uncharacterized protein